MCRLRNGVKKIRKFDVEHGSGNVFKDIGYSDGDAVNLVARAELMLKLRNVIEEKGWSQRETAKVLGVGQPRVAEIMSFNTKYFSVDLLIRYLARLGTKVSFQFKQINDD